jgi:hypothetical protein
MKSCQEAGHNDTCQLNGSNISVCGAFKCLPAGLNILRGFLEPDTAEAATAAAAANQRTLTALTSPDGAGLGGMGLARRVIACLDVRSNDAGAPRLSLHLTHASNVRRCVQVLQCNSQPHIHCNARIVL